MWRHTRAAALGRDARQTDAPFTRYELEVSMTGADMVQIRVTDLGLGEFFPSNGQIWEESFQIS